MLFDLQSPRRRRVVKFVYGGLALLLGAGLIAGTFGSGGGNGSILDTIFGGGGNSTASTAFDDQIKQAEAKLTVNPQDPQALLSLVTLHVQKGQQELNVDSSTGQQSPTVDSTTDFQKAADSWAAYLKTKPNKLSGTAAQQVAQGYLFLAESSTTAAAADANLKGAADAQKIAAEQTPTLGSLSTLAQYLYFAGDTAAADQAGKEALAKASASQKTQLTQSLAQIKKVAAQIRQQIDTAAKQEKAQAKAGGTAAGGTAGGNPFQNPLGSSGGLGGSGLGQ
ncbi:MAG: hypothetical protein QOD60_1215 [Solirubrobacterales bacterium]|nr:hypothetical protein [Solirubrobacterales bacterium]